MNQSLLLLPDVRAAESSGMDQFELHYAATWRRDSCCDVFCNPCS
jgi:hypothetical protein